MAGDSRRISEIMDRKLVAVSKSTPIKAAVKLVRTSGVNTIPVLEDGKLVGIVGEDELLAFVAKHGEKDQEQSVMVISKKPVFAEQDDTIKDTIGKVVNNKLTRIPVVESSGNMRCVGIVSASELLKEASK